MSPVTSLGADAAATEADRETANKAAEADRAGGNSNLLIGPSTTVWLPYMTAAATAPAATGTSDRRATRTPT